MRLLASCPQAVASFTSPVWGLNLIKVKNKSHQDACNSVYGNPAKLSPYYCLRVASVMGCNLLSFLTIKGLWADSDLGKNYFILWRLQLRRQINHDICTHTSIKDDDRIAWCLQATIEQSQLFCFLAVVVYHGGVGYLNALRVCSLLHLTECAVLHFRGM